MEVNISEYIKENKEKISKKFSTLIKTKKEESIYDPPEIFPGMIIQCKITKINEIFKSPIINELRETEKLLDDLILKCHKEDNFGWNFEEELNKEKILDIEDEDIKKQLTNCGNEILFKIDEKHKDLFKDIKESCKRIIDYIKQLI